MGKTKVRNIAVFSLFRDDTEEYIDRYMKMASGLSKSTEHNLNFFLAEGDSVDNTYKILAQKSRERKGFRTLKCDSGFPDMGSTVHPVRFACLSKTVNLALDEIRKGEFDYCLFLDSDLMPPDDLIDRLLASDVDMISPFVVSGPGLFYDIWGFRFPNGENFGFSMKWIRSSQIFRLQSSGGCILFRKGILDAGIRFTKEESVVGFCKKAGEAGFLLWCDPTIIVFHPSANGQTTYSENLRLNPDIHPFVNVHRENRSIQYYPTDGTTQGALRALSLLSNDPVFGQVIKSNLANKRPDVRAAIYSLAVSMHPKRYLEIGVRRGHSMAMVAYTRPECEIWGFDAWIADYGGSPNPGPEFVKDEMSNVGHRGQINLVSGNTCDTLEGTLSGRFDIILIDADHSEQGTIFDAITCMPYLARQGVMVIDDLHDSHVRSAWDQIKYRLSTHEPVEIGEVLGLIVPINSDPS